MVQGCVGYAGYLPAGTVLYIVHRELESLVLERDTLHYKQLIDQKYAELIYYGYWFSPERLALQGLIDGIQKDVMGTVRVKLYKGNCSITGRKSPNSLYNAELATFEKEDVYNQKDAEGFIKINALRLKLGKLKNPGKK